MSRIGQKKSGTIGKINFIINFLSLEVIFFFSNYLGDVRFETCEKLFDSRQWRNFVFFYEKSHFGSHRIRSGKVSMITITDYGRPIKPFFSLKS